MSLSFISDDAKNDPHRHGEEPARAQSDDPSAEKHRIGNHGQEYNSRVKAEDLTKTSCVNGGAVVTLWISEYWVARRILHLRSRVYGFAAD